MKEGCGNPQLAFALIGFCLLALDEVKIWLQTHQVLLVVPELDLLCFDQLNDG